MIKAKSLKDIIKNVSKETGVSSQNLLQFFMMGRILERLSLSEYRNNLILKGGVLVASMIGFSARATKDIDINIKDLSISLEDAINMFKSIVAMDINDNVCIHIKNIFIIRKTHTYECFRIKIDAKMENMVIPLSIDISTGDIITPSEIISKYKLLLEERSIELWTYNLETILAEKMETMLTKNVLNTRMKDFYDIYIFQTKYNADIDIKTLGCAFNNTTAYRKSNIERSNILEDLDMIFSDPLLMSLWQKYQLKFTYAKNILWQEVEVHTKELFLKLIKNI